MMKKKLYLSSPTMHGEELQYIQEAFDTNWIAPLGPNVNALEQEVASYLSKAERGIAPDKKENSAVSATPTIYAAALSAGTAAIHLALINEGIGAGDVVLCQDLTFSATCNPIVYQGATPVFLVSERESWNLDPEALRQAFRLYPEAKAVMVVNLYGTPAKLKEIKEICAEHGVPLIEDAAESLGSFYQGQMTGTFGSQAILSFNGNKIITTSGGGMLVSQDEAKITHARFLSTQAREPARHYEHKEIGYNYRMSNITAGIGRGQLLHLDEHIAKKKWIYETYQSAFADLPEVSMNPIPADCQANYWLSCLTLKEDCSVKPVDIMVALEEDNIECRPIWKPMHLQPVFQRYPFVTANESRAGIASGESTANVTQEGRDDLSSVSEDIFRRGLCLPSDIKNTEEDMERIIGIVRKELR